MSVVSQQIPSIILFLAFLIGNFPLESFAVGQNKPSGRSGNYDNLLLIGVDENSGELTGYFEDAVGWDESTKSPRFTCAFFLYGRLRGDAYEITTWYPEMGDPIKGQLKFVTVDNLSRAQIKLEELPGGCGMAHPSLTQDGGDELELSAPGNWTSVRAVSAKQAFFHKATDSRTKTKAYVVRGDAIRVFRVQNGWVEAEFGAADSNKVTRGWIQESDLFTVVTQKKSKPR